MTQASFHLHELFACVIARDLTSADRVIQVGTNMPYARAGAMLAHVTRCPDSRIALGLSFENVADGRYIPPMTPFLFDPASMRAGESLMRQAEVFDRAKQPDVFFVGGLEVDRRGNVNLQGIRAPDGTWRVRGPGVAALASMSTNCRGYYIVMTRHEPRSFVERVSCISALGDRVERRRLGLPGGGPRLLLSPLGVFEFGDDGDMRVRSLHPGVEPGAVLAATGFDIALGDTLATTAPPSETELVLLRHRIDPQGILQLDSTK